MLAHRQAPKPSNLNDEQKQKAKAFELTFEYWRPIMLGRACEAIEKKLRPYELPQLKEVMANASDSIVMSGKFGHGCIKVSASIADFLELKVQDNGTGIDPRVEPIVFRPDFASLLPDAAWKDNHPARAALFGGKGMSLLQLHEEVTSAGGVVRLQNVPTGGAELTIRLPKAALR